MNRESFTAFESVKHIWQTLGLPEHALDSIDLPYNGDYFPSSFKVDHLAQSSIAVSALAAALLQSARYVSPIPSVSVPLEHACVEFKSERLYILHDKPAPTSWGTIGGLHKTKDGYIRMHDSFPNHRSNALHILGLRDGATRKEVGDKIMEWRAVDLEAEAFRKGAVILALRSAEEWDELPQAQAISDFPILLHKVGDCKPYVPAIPNHLDNKCLRGIRVVEMSRVIAAPVAGKTLAAHGADVIWITSPTLPDLPDLDRDLGRGKRTVQLDIKQPQDKQKLVELLRTADVFIQGYRPGSLAAQGLSVIDLLQINPRLVIGNLSAWGSKGPWSKNRGFDSLVQTCSGINFEDAEAYCKHSGRSESTSDPVRVLPCQALDHGAGYMLATGIIAALYKRAIVGGSYEVEVSLAGVMKYLRSLGRYRWDEAFHRSDFLAPEDVHQYLETKQTGFGQLQAVRHSATLNGVTTGWDIMPKPLGSDEAVWLT
ncbi:CoA-transferase family III domain-containing protein [Dendryphion nanum]|uniref:CoA-transferase family III domain-containing protein n=1 Tax=Dendryphion nanum TaxID=256645 RepID=A0A9P9D9T5_9PLEO|nr:CoA-transferase family III domain-containing protein [Dendryphion nanum]